MNRTLLKKLTLNNSIFKQQVRFARKSKFVHAGLKRERPYVYKSLEERIQDDNYMLNDPELYKPVNIGVKSDEQTNKIKKIRLSGLNEHLEKASRTRTLKIDLDVVEDDWFSTIGPFHICNLANHYGIFKDLFGPFAYFYPSTTLNVAYDFDGDSVSPVYFGNTIKPAEASAAPQITYESGEDDLWTVMMVSPDNNIIEEEMDSLHWFIGNIKGNDLSTGETIMDYMRPYPPKGTGYHRYVYLLLKQTHKIDFSSLKKELPCLNLQDRNFSMYGFYKENEDVFTPAGLSWFQSDWDPSTKKFFHSSLEMMEPIYEYQFPERYLAPQREYPNPRKFNTYLDMHRDPKSIAKEVLLERLKGIHPFEEEKLLEFPAGIHVPRDTIVWEKEDLKHKRIGFGKYRDMFRGRKRPEIVGANF